MDRPTVTTPFRPRWGIDSGELARQLVNLVDEVRERDGDEAARKVLNNLTALLDRARTALDEGRDLSRLVASAHHPAAVVPLRRRPGSRPLPPTPSPAA